MLQRHISSRASMARNMKLVQCEECQVPFVYRHYSTKKRFSSRYRTVKDPSGNTLCEKTTWKSIEKQASRKEHRRSSTYISMKHHAGAWFEKTCLAIDMRGRLTSTSRQAAAIRTASPHRESRFGNPFCFNENYGMAIL